MKETIKKTLSILLALLMLTSVLPLKGIELPDFGIKARAAENGNESTAEDSVVDSGSCGADGSDVHWTFYESGKLVISGTGAMEDYDFDEPPVRDTDNPPEEPLTEEPLTEEPSTDGAVPSPVSAVESAAVAEDSEHGEKSVKPSIGSIAAAFAQKSPLAVLNDGEASGDAEVEPYSEDGSDSAVPDPEQPTEPTENVKKKTPWFDYTYRVKEVVVEEGITHIGDLAFAFFVELTKISLPQSLIGIGNGSFAYCFKLESIPLPKNLEEIGNTAFFSALSVKVLDLPQSLKKLGGAAFGYLMSVEKLEYPGGSVETDEAEPPFYCMTGLKELVIPEDAVLTDDVLGNVLDLSYSLKTVKNYSDTIALSEKMTMFQDYEAAQKYSVFLKAQYSYAIQFEAGVGNGISSEKQYYEYIIAAVNEEFGTAYTTADLNMLMEEIEPVGAGVAPYVALYCKETSAEHEACRTNGYMHYLVETDAPCSCNMSGTLDSGLEWAVNAETKTLTFSGSGDIADYDLTQGNIPPYSRFAAVIENVEFADGVNISEAGDFAFSCLENVKTLSLPEGITVFGECTFYKSGYEVLNLPASFQYLNSFIMGNNKLRTVNVADGNELYESVNGALYMRATGEDGTVYRYLIKMPETSYAGGFAENVASVFFGAMERYSQTPEIRFPETVCGIMTGAIFESNVTSVYIGAGQIQVGDTVKQMSDDSIDEDFAYNCNHLEEISVNPENPAFTSVDGVLCNKAVTKIVRCPVAKTGFVIPQTVTEIGYDAFDNCVMPQIDLPENVAVVGNCAFDSDWLEKIAVRNASCDISDSCTLGNTETVVYGHLGSTAEVSADKHRQRFVSFDNVEIVGITLDTSKVKTRYTVGEKLDTTGLVVYGDYSDGTRADKTAYVSFGWFNSSAPGTYTVEVRYKDFTASYDVTVEAALDYKTGDIIEFGSYPQSEVTDAALKSALTSKAGSTDGWTSYDYYISGEQSDYMKYTDVEYGGEKYRGVYFTKYRPYHTDNSSSTDNSEQDDNGYNTSTVYWFKYEPMKWQVLSFDKTTGNAMVLSKDIIDSQQYYNNRNNRTIGGKTVYSNNYEHSDIRAWLNGAFYDGAFSASEKNAIIATTLDNSARNAQYDSNSTTDKVWLLSCSEAQNTAYGFSSDGTRQAKGSAYALCQGLYKYSSNGCSCWRLRSAGDYGDEVFYVDDFGCVDYIDDVYYTDSGVRPALKINLTSCDHVWQEEVIPPTCTKRGYTLHTCTKCGAGYRNNYTAPLGHDWDEGTVTDPTCTSQGYTKHRCTRCDSITYDTYTDPLGHTPDGGETTIVAPACTEKGYTVYTCSVCGEKYDDTYTDALGHDWDEGTVTDPTCTSQGYTAHNCTRCGSTTRDTYTDALGHDWDEGTVVDPTCTSQGYTDRSCTRCGSTTRDTYTDALGHDWNDVITPPTCTEEGYTAHNCTRCGSTTRDTYTDPLGHTPDGGETTVVSPTCTEKGYTVYTCSVCGEKYNDTYTDPLGHDWAAEPVRVEPTCTEAGYTRRECTRCDVLKNIKWDAKYASSHPYSNNAADEYTFRYPGAESIELVFNADTQFERNYDFLYIYDGRDNLVGKYSDNELSSRKVVINGDAFKLKLTSDGSVTRYGFEIESITVNVPASMDAEYTILPALGHDWDEGIITPPTCTEQGYTKHNCTRCSETMCDTYVAPLGHDWDEGTVTDPTCTSQGYTKHRCTRCDSITYDTYTDALGHDWDEGTVTDPTCTSQGYTKHRCTRCDSITYDTYTDALGHDWSTEWTVDEPVTCTKNGSKSHHCTRCDAKNDVTVISCPGHDYGEFETDKEPTCTDKGSKKKVCANCNDTVYEDIPALGHDYASEWTVDKAATCTADGSKSHHCSRCDGKSDVTVIPATGHAYGEFETVKEPTCTDKGSKKKVCANCNDMVYEDIPALGHDYASEWTVDKAATCTADGSKSHHCSRCDGKSDVTVIPATGHAYGEFETVKEPTCTDKGSKKKVCANCKDMVYEDIPALGHDYASEWTVDKAATCTADGSKSHHCSRCDVKSDITVIPATGHAYGEFETVKEPTCTDKGSKKKVCANCNDTVYEDIPALGHDYASEWTVDKAATCTADGSKSHHCSRCDGKSDVTVIPATGHAYGEFETVKEPTCTDKGSKKKVCANCNDTVYEDIPALGHNWATEWTVDVPVTCTSDGSKSRHCLRCDAKTDVLSLTSSGHAFGEWVTEKAADCTKDGLETRKCATCGAVEKKVIEKLGHDYPEYTVTKATTVLCEGEERAECARCGNIDVRVIPKIQIDTDSNKNYGLANFTVVNAQTKEPIKGANLFISTENDGENTFVTDENGKVGIVLPIGRQTVSAYADGCLTRNLKINIQSGTNEIPLIGLSSKKTYDVEVNHHLMTKEEIEEAGIDTDAPENNHVFKYEVTFEFEPEIDWLSIFYYMNGNGDILGGGSGGSGGGSGGSGGGSGYGGAWYGDGGGKGHFRAKNEKTGEVVNVYPVSEYFYLIIRGEVRWLKEMFDVEMLVVNNSETDTLEYLSAELELPDGLSLATMKGEQQTLKKELENVAEGKTTSAHWYVRGDKAGSYEIAASLKGTVMPFEEEINDVFKAKNALQVWAGNALHLDFEVPSSAYYAKDYPIKITLTNVSDITLYNVSHYITGIEQSRVTYYSDGKVEKEIYMKKDTNIGEFVTEFNPGDKIVIELSVNIMFQSKLMEYRLNQLIGKVDRIEQLIKAFKAIKTGLDIADGLISAIGSASKAVDSFISSASAELAEKVTLARDLKSALVDFEMAYSKFENKTVDAAVKLTNSAVGASLKAFTQEPDEWLKKTSVKDIKKLISGVKTLGNSLSGQPSKAEIKKFNVFDSIRTLISAIPIVFTLKNVFLVEDEDNTTSIPWSCTVTQSGPEYFGVANLSRHLSNILIAGSSDLIKGMLPSYIFLIPGANSALSAEDAKREIIAVEKEITRFKARSASGDVTYKAYVVRNTQTQSMMLRSVSALSDGFILSSDNDTARFENGVLTFTGDGMIEVTPADLSGGTLVVEDSDGNKYEYEMTVVAQHECTPDEREVIISPTADNDGFAVDCCSVCGDVLNVELLSAKECTHSYGEWVEDIAAVCNAEGLRHRDCTLCGYSESEVTEPTDRHVPGEWIIDREATCTETGEKHTVCSVCGTVSETAAIEKIAHTMTGWAVKTAATCTAEGVSERSCTECGYAETKPIAKTEHTSSGWIGISAATCTEDGERCMKCTVCGAVLKTEAVPAHGHADADKNGKCDNCGESLTSSCKHICHSKNKLAQFFWKMIRLMYKLFKNHEFCDCGVRHW